MLISRKDNRVWFMWGRILSHTPRHYVYVMLMYAMLPGGNTHVPRMYIRPIQ